MHTIWFNQGYSSVADALVAIRAEAGGAVRTIASHRDAHAPAMAAADVAIAEPEIDRHSREYVDWCLGVCADHGVDLFVAQSGRAALAPWHDTFATIGTKLSVPADAATLATIDDKALFYPAALAAGLPMPWTREVGTPEAFNAALADLGGPACVKPPEGVFGAGFWRLDAGRDLFATLMNPDAHVISADAIRLALAGAEAPRLLVLEYLGGPEWSIDCVARDGAMPVAVARLKQGRAQRLEVEGPAIELARRTVKAFGLSGLINVQLRAADAEGRDLRLLEINSRMSGGCLYTQHAGVSLPWLHVALELGLIDDLPLPRGGAVVAPVTGSRIVTASPAYA